MLDNEEIPELAWAKELEINKYKTNNQELVIGIPDNIDPITGEIGKQEDCEGCSS